MSNNTVLLITLSLVLLIFSVNGVEADEDVTTNQLLEVKVYYETLCPDSMRFMRHLYHSMINNNRLPFTDLKFIPYGKVMSWTDPATNVTSLFCQHGEEECNLNALHACIVEHNCIEEQVEMFHCLLKGFNTNVDRCASLLNIDVTEAKECKANRSVTDILHKYGVETDAIDLSFVPSIGMDNTFDEEKQFQIRNNFDDVFCKTYKKKYNIVLEKCTK